MSARIATLEEIDRSWTLGDLLVMNEVLDALEDAKIEAAERPHE